MAIKRKSHIKSLKKIGQESPQSNQLQENVDQALKPIADKAILNGTLIKNVCLYPGKVTEVLHELGRAPLGWLIVRKRQDARIWDVQDYNDTPERTLALVTSHDVQLDLWIF